MVSLMTQIIVTEPLMVGALPSRDRSLIGTAAEGIEQLRKLEAAGVEQVFIWPIADELRQMRPFAEDVAAHFRKWSATVEPAN
jgi:hypothetical protein